jgi:hypothetical protein
MNILLICNIFSKAVGDFLNEVLKLFLSESTIVNVRGEINDLNPLQP